ncbi:unnamed protein product [Rodentolepis nana]|uniref:TAF4 domain-containing protein n=1 Tax=Rodentolepis nana TaxID=102285 RepID=A0A0R3TUP2_RODNA|nr:unnamed protein product [Rodentolepis nana]
MSRQVINRPVYIVKRAPPSQPNLLPVRSLPNQALNHQTNGVVGTQAPGGKNLFPAMLSHICPIIVEPSAAQASGSAISLAKFLNHILTSRKAATGERAQVTQLVQDLIVSCDVFLVQLYSHLKTSGRQDVDNLFYTGLPKLRMNLINGTAAIPNIRPPNPSVLVGASTITTAATVVATSTVSQARRAIIHTPSQSSASHNLPPPSPVVVGNLPPNSTFQLSTSSKPIRPAPLRPITPRLHTSLFSPRAAVTNSPTPIRLLLPVSTITNTTRLQLRHKPPTNHSTALFRSESGTTLIAPNPPTILLPLGTKLRTLIPSPLPPSTPSITSSSAEPAPNSTLTPPASSFLSPHTTVSSTTNVSSSSSSSSKSMSSPQPTACSQLDQPFFPVSQIRLFLASKLPPNEVASLTEDSLNCMAHGLNTLLRSLLTRISLVAGHKATKFADDPHLEQVDHAREQIGILQKMHEFDQEKRCELQTEFIHEAAKASCVFFSLKINKDTRKRNGNGEEAKIREMAIQLKKEKDERERQEQANLTALSAIGTLPNKRPRLSMNLPSSEQTIITTGGNLSSNLNSSTNAATAINENIINPAI